MIKTKKIKDNIHGYIYYSGLEGLFLSHKLVLRLHHVRQNGAAFLTYPSIRVHRYEHSLGAMHVAGLLFLNSVKFSADSRLVETIKDVVSHICDHRNIGNIRLQLTQTAIGRDVSFITSDGLYHMNSLASLDDDTLALLLLYQATRIAVLVHDIGHPPFSHTFEMGLKQLGVDYDDHERVGLELLSLILEDLRKDQENLVFTFAELVAKVVEAIVDRADPNHDLVKGVAEFVSGDIDADRLDYVRRDALSGGLSTNSYDIGRLYDAVKLHTDHSKSVVAPRGGRVNSISLHFHAEALSTLEAFFSMRFHLYRWMLFHHSVILRNMVLVSITHGLHWLAKSSVRQVNDLADEIINLALRKDRREDYWFFTDAYLLDKLAAIQRVLETSPDALKSDQRARDLFADLETFLFRAKRYIAPLWKRPEHYAEFAERMFPGEPDPIVKMNDLFRKKYLEVMAVNKSALPSPKADNVDYHSRQFAIAIENALNSVLAADDGRIRAYYLARFKPAPTGLQLHTAGRLHDLGVLSPSIPALETAWRALPQLWLFHDTCIAVETGSNGRARLQVSAKSRQDILSKVLLPLKQLISP